MSSGEAYLAVVQPMVWQAASRENFVDDVQAMRRRVEEHVPAAEADRQLKLGPGGLRDVEFSVQLLQLVHGRADDSLRSRTTLEALAALSRGGYVGRDDAAVLDAAYRFLRTLEHRIQLHRLRRTHLMPTADADLRRLGRAVGFRRDPAADVVHEWQRPGPRGAPAARADLLPAPPVRRRAAQHDGGATHVRRRPVSGCRPSGTPTRGVRSDTSRH